MNVSGAGALSSSETRESTKAATRWPKLQIDFMTIHASKGQQADYVILVGLQEGNDGFPPRRENPLWKVRFFLRLRIFRTLKSGVCYMWR